MDKKNARASQICNLSQFCDDHGRESRVMIQIWSLPSWKKIKQLKDSLQANIDWVFGEFAQKSHHDQGWAQWQIL